MPKCKSAIISLLLLASISFSGCSARSSLQTGQPSPTLRVFEITPSSPVAVSSVQPNTVQTKTVSMDQVIVWVPPEFNPSASASGSLLQQQLDVFIQNHPGVTIDVRVKETDGPAGLLSSLEKSLDTAPSIAPSLVLLPDDDLEAAAGRSIIQSPENFQTILQQDDWYAYARELSLFQNNFYGIPFAADAMILAVRTSSDRSNPVNWAPLLSVARPLLFPAADTQAMFTINLYLSAGGTFFDEQNKVHLDVETLEKVLNFYVVSNRAGYILPTIMDYENDEQVWAAFENKLASQVVCRLSDYFSQDAADVLGLTIPPLENEPVTIVSGWVWVLTDPYQNRMELDLELMQHLTAPDFQAEIAMTGGYLPVRPSSLSKWDDPVRTALISQASISAVSRPPHDILNLIGPVFNEAVYNVLVKKIQPSEAARDAAQEINID